MKKLWWVGGFAMLALGIGAVVVSLFMPVTYPNARTTMRTQTVTAEQADNVCAAMFSELDWLASAVTCARAMPVDPAATTACWSEYGPSSDVARVDDVQRCFGHIIPVK